MEFKDKIKLAFQNIWFIKIFKIFRKKPQLCEICGLNPIHLTYENMKVCISCLVDLKNDGK